MSSSFQSKIIKDYEAKGYLVLKLIRLNLNGFPDLLCLKDGKAIFIESKEENDTLKPLQEFRIQQLKDLGFEAFTLQNETN
jgi:hypothetical protein